MKKDIMKVAIVMGSISDEPIMKNASDTLKSFGIKCETHILSAHRMPNKTREFAENLNKSGGVPVACVAINGAKNAALLAIEIIALSNEDMADKIKKFKHDMEY